MLEGKSFSPQALPMHSHFAYCSSTSHIPVPNLPGWGLQVPVMQSQFLKPGAHCRGLWNWHRDHLVQYQPGWNQEPDLDSSLQSYAMGNTGKARGAFQLLPSETSVWNGCFQGDSIEILSFTSDPIYHTTVFGAEGIALSPAKCKCSSLV